MRQFRIEECFTWNIRWSVRRWISAVHLGLAQCTENVLTGQAQIYQADRCIHIQRHPSGRKRLPAYRNGIDHGRGMCIGSHRTYLVGVGLKPTPTKTGHPIMGDRCHMRAYSNHFITPTSISSGCIIHQKKRTSFIRKNVCIHYLYSLPIS